MKSQQQGKGFPDILKLIILLLLIAGAVTSIAYSFRKEKAQEKGKAEIYLYCTKCGEIYVPKERLGGDHPRVCDKCKAKAAWYAMQCKDCGKIFPEAMVCPECGSMNCKLYDPKDKIKPKEE